jgi:putative tryptophan/tyrosine transport system substrate-binding protein
MNRRAFLYGLTLGTLSAPLAAEAQSAGRTPVIGFLVPAAGPPSGWIEALRLGLRDLGYIEGQNIKIDYRFSEGRAERFPDLLAEFVRLKVDVIVTYTTPAALAAKTATNTIPIVVYTGNPVATGLVASLARPGGNVTGVTILTEEIERKNLSLLREALPTASRIAVFTNPTNPVWPPTLRALEETAETLRVRLVVIEVRGVGGFEAAFATARRERAEGLLILRDGLFTGRWDELVPLAARYQLPAMYGNSEFVIAGGLMAYSVSFPDIWRTRISRYVDRILRGAKPADLPVEQPTKFDLFINLKTAKALGLTIPPSLLLRADQVIE